MVYSVNEREGQLRLDAFPGQSPCSCLPLLNEKTLYFPFLLWSRGREPGPTLLRRGDGAGAGARRIHNVWSMWVASNRRSFLLPSEANRVHATFPQSSADVGIWKGFQSVNEDQREKHQTATALLLVVSLFVCLLLLFVVVVIKACLIMTNMSVCE